MNPPAINRRRTRRQPAKKTVKLRCQKGTWGLGPNVARTLLDVSTDGARLVIAVPLESNRDVTLSLEGPWHKHPLAIAARVRWCEPLADGAYCVGVVFEKTIPYREVQDLASADDV
jgi:hypothetical protein